MRELEIVGSQSGVSDAIKATDAADAYEHILTIQNAADLEFPATGPANVSARCADTACAANTEALN